MLIAALNTGGLFFSPGGVTTTRLLLVAPLIADPDWQASAMGMRGRVPGGFNEGSGYLELGTEGYWLKKIGSTGLVASEKIREWSSADLYFPVPNYGRYTVFASEDAILFLSEFEIGSGFRTVLVLRTREIRGWNRERSTLKIYSLADDEELQVPCAKFVIAATKPDTEVALRIYGFAHEVKYLTDLDAIDATTAIGLPRSTSQRSGVMLCAVPLLVGAFLFLGLVAIGSRFPAGPITSTVAYAVGGVVLVAGILTAIAGFVLISIETSKAGRLQRRELERRSTAEFLDHPQKWAEQLVRWAKGRGVALDFTPRSMLRLRELEPYLQCHTPWRSTAYGYAAYIAEVIRRESGGLSPFKWSERPDGVGLLLPKIGISLPVYEYATARATLREKMSPEEFYDLCRRMIAQARPPPSTATY